MDTPPSRGIALNVDEETKMSEDTKGRITVDPTPYHKPEFREIFEKLTTDEMVITQGGGTEQAFTGRYWNHFEPGIYVDVITGEPLFSSADKYRSTSGWASFAKPIDPDVIVTYEDRSRDMIRTGLRSRVGETHLGHVFEDGPANLGGLRYCVNSTSLLFVPLAEMDAQGYGYLKPLCE